MGTLMQQSNTPEVLVELKDVSVVSTSEPDKQWINDWNWEVKDGEFWVLGGMAGSGKTALISVAAGLTKPGKGSMALFGKQVHEEEPENWLSEKLNLGMVFEDGGRVFQDLSVYDNLMLPLSYHEIAEEGQNHQWVLQILEMMGMSAMLNRLAGRLSRNWRQRLGLARAIVLRPQVLFLDNPLGVIDSHHGHWWLGFIDDLIREKGEWKPRSIVVTASDLTPWIERVNCLALIHEGEWKELDPSNHDALVQHDLVRALSTGMKQAN